MEDRHTVTASPVEAEVETCERLRGGLAQSGGRCLQQLLAVPREPSPEVHGEGTDLLCALLVG